MNKIFIDAVDKNVAAMVVYGKSADKKLYLEAGSKNISIEILFNLLGFPYPGLNFFIHIPKSYYSVPLHNNLLSS